MNLSFLHLDQLFIHRRLTSKIGLIMTHRAGLMGMGLVVLFVPIAGKLSNVAMWIYLIFVFSMFSFAQQMCFSSVFALVANSTEKRMMGTVNGVSQSAVGFLRALTPIIAGRLFDWSISDLNRSFPNIYFNFLLQFLLFAGLLCLTLGYSNSINKPRDEVEQIEMQRKGEPE